MDGSTFPAPTPDVVADAPPRLDRRALAKARTRAKVLAAAARTLFEDAGYERATIRDIAALCGMSTGAIFANFKDKADLYLAVHGHPPLTPEQGLKLAQALRGAEAFISGFEGDPLQEGIDPLLDVIRRLLPPLAEAPEQPPTGRRPKPPCPPSPPPPPATGW